MKCGQVSDLSSEASLLELRPPCGGFRDLGEEDGNGGGYGFHILT
jgi:hypothetical protein